MKNKKVKLILIGLIGLIFSLLFSGISVETRSNQYTRNSENTANQINKVNADNKQKFEESNFLKDNNVQLYGNDKPSDNQGGITPAAIDLSTPGVLRIIIANSSSGSSIGYGLPGMTVDVSVLAKGPFSNRNLKVELKRDIALGTDTVLASVSFQGVTMANTDEQWFNMTGVILDSGFSSFGFTSGLIRKYYVQFIDTTPFPDDVIFRGGDVADGGTGTGILYMRGEFRLESIQYYNVTTNNFIPITVTEGNWILTTVVQLSIVNGPIWDFSIYVDFRYDVRFGIDDNILDDQVPFISSFSIDGYYLPGNYSYIPLDTNGQDAYLTLDGARAYGGGLGQTRKGYGVLQQGDETGSNLIDVSYLFNRDFSEINILTNIKNSAPQVQFISPTDGDIVDTNTFSITAKVEDANSNYLISSILLNGTEVISDYNPLTGELLTTFILSSFDQGSILQLELTAIDDDGLSGSDLVIIQIYDASSFLPDGYSITNTSLTEKIYDNLFEYSMPFNYTGDTVEISITPIFSLGFSIESVVDIFVASPNSVEGGDLAVLYTSVSNPKVITRLNISLDLIYTFSAGDLYFSGMRNLYFEEFVREWIVELGIYTFDLADLLGKETADRLTNFELDVTKIFSGPLDWLVDLSFSLEIENLFKQVSSISTDIQVSNGVSTLNTLTWTDENIKSIPVQVNITDAPSLDIELSNYRYNYQFGLEIYFQFRLTGKIAGINLLSIDLNSWMERNLGIIIPKIDLWLIELQYNIPGLVLVTSQIIPRSANGEVLGLSRNNASQSIFIQYDSYQVLLSGANITGIFMGNVYAATESSTGVYEFVLPNNPANETFTIIMSKLGYQIITLNFFIEAPIIPVEVVTTVTTTATSTITDFQTSTSVSTVTTTESTTSEIVNTITTTINGTATTILDTTTITQSGDIKTVTETSPAPLSLFWVLGFFGIIFTRRMKSLSKK